MREVGPFLKFAHICATDTLVYTVVYIFLRKPVEGILSERKTFLLRLDLFTAYIRQNIKIYTINKHPTCRCCTSYSICATDTLVYTVVYIFLRKSVEDILSERKTFLTPFGSVHCLHKTKY